MIGRLIAVMGLLALGVATSATAAPDTADVVEIRAIMSPDGAQVYFDPIGVHIRPGQTVRWIQANGYHSVTAYHPANDNHQLRIPPGAQPWDSGVLLKQWPEKGSTFEHTFTREGVYDYFCRPHEAAGMVGRIVVGTPREQPVSRASLSDTRPIPEAARKNFPAVSEILQKGVVRYRAR